MKRNYEDIGLHVPEIMLPSENVDLTVWSVVACDQFTSQPEYWEDVKRITEGKPSAFHLTLPEIYLKDENVENRIKAINKTMEDYNEKGVLKTQRPGFILVDRKTCRKKSRKGLIVAVDLEKYDFSVGSTSLIRATEGTVIDRLPPRVKIRENALLELPHIIMLIDDPSKTVIEPLIDQKERFEKVYDFELMKNGGHITGWRIEDEGTIASIAEAMKKLAQKNNLLFAVGDGNHSLASAKVHWENVKRTCGLDSKDSHPARYALAEVVNVHDEGIEFEPIHRIIFNVDVKLIFKEMEDAGVEIIPNKGLESAAAGFDNKQVVPFISEGVKGLLLFNNPVSAIAVGSLQAVIDKLCQKYPDMEVDYIHGNDVVTELGSRKGNIGFYLPAMDKNDLFKTVIKDGVLPRKTFSMGEAEEKRYYLECRKIR